MIAPWLIAVTTLSAADVGIRKASGVGVEYHRAGSKCAANRTGYIRPTLRANPSSTLFESGSCLYVRVANGRLSSRSAEYILCLGETDQQGRGDFVLTDVLALEPGDSIIVTVDSLGNASPFAEAISSLLKGALKLVAGQVPAVAGLDDAAATALKSQLKTSRENLGSAVFATSPSHVADACLVPGRPYLIVFNSFAATDYQLRDTKVTDKHGQRVDDLPWLVAQFEEVTADAAWAMSEPSRWRALSGSEPEMPSLSSLLPADREAIDVTLGAVRRLAKLTPDSPASEIRQHASALGREVATHCPKNKRSVACELAARASESVASNASVASRLQMYDRIQASLSMSPCDAANALWTIKENSFAPAGVAASRERQVFVEARLAASEECVRSSGLGVIRDDRVRRALQSGPSARSWFTPVPDATSLAIDCGKLADSLGSGMRDYVQRWCTKAVDELVLRSSNYAIGLTLARNALVAEAAALGVTLLAAEVLDDAVAPFVRPSVLNEFSVDVPALRAAALMLKSVKSRYEPVPQRVAEVPP